MPLLRRGGLAIAGGLFALPTGYRSPTGLLFGAAGLLEPLEEALLAEARLVDALVAHALLVFPGGLTATVHRALRLGQVEHLGAGEFRSIQRTGHGQQHRAQGEQAAIAAKKRGHKVLLG